MDKDKKKIIAGAGIFTGVGLAYLLSKRAAAEEPPAEGYGRFQGFVRDAATSAKIKGARIYVDGAFDSYSDQNGIYRTNWLPFGQHTVTAEADNYTKGQFPVSLETGLMDMDLILVPLKQAPGEWTDGVIVTKIVVSPSTAFLGETINIDVYIQYPDPLPVPAEIHGTVLVDSTQISGDYTIGFRNPTLRFRYACAVVGTFTARAQDKSAGFTVTQDKPAKYYSPFGGVRMPACIQVIIPNVEPFESWGQKFEGGDYLVDGYSDLKVYNVRQLIDGLQRAKPSKWDPSDAVVRNWVTKYRTWPGTWFSPSGAGLIVMATDYDCREYWNSKEELANMIATGLGQMGIAIPEEWKLQYGTTCPNCNGTGQVICTERMRACRPGQMTTCPTCSGRGKILRVDLSRGFRDWVYPIRYYSLCGGGSCIPRLYCPYCDSGFDGPPHTQARAWDVISFVRSFLRHIEEKHPRHPLTSPASF